MTEQHTPATVDTVEDTVRQLRRDIDEAKGLAATHGFRIDDGRIVEPEGEAGADTASVKSDLVERVDSILAKAKEVDTDLATMLDKVLADKISDEGATTLAQAAEVANPVGAAVRNSFAQAVAGGRGADYVPMLSDIVGAANGIAEG